MTEHDQERKPSPEACLMTALQFAGTDLIKYSGSILSETALMERSTSARRYDTRTFQQSTYDNIRRVAEKLLVDLDAFDAARPGFRATRA